MARLKFPALSQLPISLAPPRITTTDVIAGASVAMVLIPQSLAYAELAQLPPYIGLYASAFPLLVFALLASSPYLQTGPVAVTSLLTIAALPEVPPTQ
ncbi:SulP family inorganic anion transporter, partial [Acidimicrobiales bacterium]|nr:SulP family inorganic anion transporter [Acidimicrobiales bacterium]